MWETLFTNALGQWRFENNLPEWEGPCFMTEPKKSTLTPVKLKEPQVRIQQQWCSCSQHCVQWWGERWAVINEASGESYNPLLLLLILSQSLRSGKSANPACSKSTSALQAYTEPLSRHHQLISRSQYPNAAVVGRVGSEGSTGFRSD